MQRSVAIYLRISNDRTGQAVGVGRQRKDCTDTCQRYYPDHEVVEYVDNDKSAYDRTVFRPGYEQMLVDVREGRVHAIVAWDQDRLLRRNRALEDFIDLVVPLHVPVRTAKGDLDLETSDGQAMARIMASIHTKSSDDTSRRVKRAALDRAENGKFHGGRYMPYGLVRHDDMLVHDPVAVGVIRQMAAAILDGVVLQKAIRDIAAGYPGAPRTREGWRFLLTGQIIRGRNTAGHPAEWQAMIDPTTASSLAVMLAPKSTRRPNRVWPLSGYLECECGTRMVGHRDYTRKRCSGRYPYYQCINCWGAITEAPLMAYVTKLVNDFAVTVPRRRDTTVEDEQREQALEHLAAEYASGKISRREWEAFRAALPARMTPARDVAPADVELTFAQKLAHGVDRIVIARAATKGGRFDYHRVQITWLR